MIKKLVSVIASSGIVFLSIGIVQAGDMPGDSASNNGKILRSSNCHLRKNDPRFCWRLAVQLQSGKVLPAVSFFQFVKIYDGDGKTLYKNPYSADDGTILKEPLPNSKEGKSWRGNFYAAASHLKKGVNVRMDNLDCEIPDSDPNEQSCETFAIHIK